MSHERKAWLEIPTDHLAAKKSTAPINAHSVDTFDPRGVGAATRFPTGTVFYQWREMAQFPGYVVMSTGVQRDRQGWAITLRDFARLRDEYVPSPHKRGDLYRRATIRLAHEHPELRPLLLPLLRD